MKSDGQSNVVYIIYDKENWEFVYQYRTYQYNPRKGIFKTYNLCKNVCAKMNAEVGKEIYEVYTLRR